MTKRCTWVGHNKPHYNDYHDKDWGVPVHDDRLLFEMLTLEGAQAGLNWETILKKREGYRRAFHNFDIEKVASMNDDALEALRHNPNIIRNRLKIFSTRKNAQVVLTLQKEFTSFGAYLWDFVGGKPLIGHWEHDLDVPTTTPLSDLLSKELKKRGMSFVGSTIMYAYMQAVGLVNDHVTRCFRYGELSPPQIKSDSF